MTPSGGSGTQVVAVGGRAPCAAVCRLDPANPGRYRGAMAITPRQAAPPEHAPTARGRWDRPRRLAVLVAILVVFAWAASGPIRHVAGLVGASDWGSDWRWLQDGLDRLAAGLPLNRPEYVTAPFSQATGSDGAPTYTWSLHPPYNASLVAALLLVPAGIREGAWAGLMAVALAGAVLLAWPRRLWWGTSLLLAAAALGPPLYGPSIGLVDQLHFANPNALVLLGLALAWWGRRRASGRAAIALVATGVVLAAVKIVPAMGLAAWLLAAREGRGVVARGSLLAAAVLIALTLPVLLLDPGVIGDTIAVQLNVVPLANATNLAPSAWLAPLLGTGAAAWISRGVGLGLMGFVLARRLDGPGGFVLAATAPLLVTPQLWAHWFLLPILAALFAAGAWPRLRGLDARLRSAGAGGRAPLRG